MKSRFSGAQKFRHRYLDIEESHSCAMSGKGIAQEWLSDRKSTRLNSSHSQISYAVFCLKKKQLRVTVRDDDAITRLIAAVREIARVARRLHASADTGRPPPHAAPPSRRRPTEPRTTVC